MNFLKLTNIELKEVVIYFYTQENTVHYVDEYDNFKTLDSIQDLKKFHHFEMLKGYEPSKEGLIKWKSDFQIFWKQILCVTKDINYKHSYNHNSAVISICKMRTTTQISKYDISEITLTEFKYFEKFPQSWRETRGIECDEKKCEINNFDKKILVLLGRNKLSEICSENFDIIVNLTSKYKLPECFSKDKIIIDNADFYQKGGHFLYFDKEQIRIETARKSRKARKD